MLKIVRSENPDFVLFTLSGHIDVEHAQSCKWPSTERLFELFWISER